MSKSVRWALKNGILDAMKGVDADDSGLVVISYLTFYFRLFFYPSLLLLESLLPRWFQSARGVERRDARQKSGGGRRGTDRMLKIQQ